MVIAPILISEGGMSACPPLCEIALEFGPFSGSFWRWDERNIEMGQSSGKILGIQPRFLRQRDGTSAESCSKQFSPAGVKIQYRED
jgi:hypothetical protein